MRIILWVEGGEKGVLAVDLLTMFDLIGRERARGRPECEDKD